MSERIVSAHAPGGGSPDFTVHQRTVFCMVAQHLSYTRAAEALYLSRPAVAQQVKTIEQTLGLRLFARSGRSIVLTPAVAPAKQYRLMLATKKRLLTPTKPHLKPPIYALQ